MKVFIAGAGIGGLSTAHYLAKYTDYEIHVYDVASKIGGLVASHHTSQGMPTQHSPRVILPNYDLLTDIMKDIPFNEGTTFDNLVQTTSITVRDGVPEKVKILNPKMGISEFVSFGYTLLDGLLSCTKRAEELDRLKVYDLIHSEQGRRWIRLLSHIAGEVPEVMPMYKMLRFLEIDIKTLLGENKTKHSYALNGPYSSHFLEPWQEYLEEQGVVFHLNTKIHNFEQNKVMIQEAYQKASFVEADIIVLALNIDSLNKVLKHSHLDTHYVLADRTFSEQLGLQLGFKEKLRLPTNEPSFYALDSDWQMIIEPQEINFQDVFLGNQVKSLWSITIPDVNLYSTFLEKTVKDCSKEELLEEVQRQIKKELNVKGTLVQSSINDPIQPYTWNSANTLHLRPNVRLAPNVYVASTLTKNDYYMTYKEGACEAALTVVEDIVGKRLVKRNRRVNLLHYIHKLDEFLYNQKMPSVLNTVLTIVLFYLISIIAKRMRR